MDNEIEELAILEGKHRKEKKELQAQIQALKKAAKNDKTKKKELTAQIARLEAEMDARHQQEIDSASANKDVDDIPDTVLDNVENELSKAKISKAQKRREKKSQQEKEREELIKHQEQENLHGPRNTELQAINRKLNERGFKMFLIPSDGDCLYKAIAHQMTLTKQKQLSVENLREIVAIYIRQHKDDFIPFMTNPDTCEMMTSEEFEEYCNKIENTKVWGGQLEIRALSNSLKCPISVIQATGTGSIDQGTEYEGSPLVITYHRHMYGLGEHYNSTIPSEI